MVSRTLNRNIGIDVLKTICAFLVVYIHFGAYSAILGRVIPLPINRIAVPIFFMVTGYFSEHTERSGKETVQMKKILKLALIYSVVYMCWSIILHYNDPLAYIKSENILKGIVYFVLFNAPLLGARHIWYLYALLYVLIIVYILKKKNLNRYVKYIVPVLIIMALALGKYSTILFKREFSEAYSRNFLFTGLPFYCIGNEIYNKRDYIKEKINKNLLIIIIAIFAALNYIEHESLRVVFGNGDIYVMTVFLAVSVFLYFALFFKDDNKQMEYSVKFGGGLLAHIGREYSLYIYIFHILIGNAESILINKMLPKLMPAFVILQPFIVFVTTLLFVIIYTNVLSRIKSCIRNRAQGHQKALKAGDRKK